MSDNIKLPPMQQALEPDLEDHEYELWGQNVKADFVTVETAIAYAREAVRLNAQAVPGEPDWRHPKIQGLIGSEARLRITIDLIWQILEDPNQEFTASDMEYWDTIHDKLKAALSAAPAAPQPAQQPLTDEQANCWCESCDLAKGHPCGRTRMSICPNCGDKRCPRAKHHNNECQQAHGIGVKP